MILTTHSIVGASITNLFPGNPGVGSILAFVSHYLLDMVPHKDYDVKFIDEESKTIKSAVNNLKSALHFLPVALDLLVGVILCILIFVRDEQTFYLTFFGIIAGVLPDFFQFLYLKYKKHPFIIVQKFHDHIHNRSKPITGYLSQFLTIVISISIYFLIK